MAKKNNGKNPKVKKVTINLSWLYIILLGVIIWMMFSGGGGSANPQKIEWDEVKAIAQSGDIKEIEFIRNEYTGEVTIRPDSLGEYASHFGGNVPKKSPHFTFLVSNSFNAEEMFDELNQSLPEAYRFKVVINKKEHIWGNVMEWLLFPILMIIMWVFMFRGLNRGGGGPGGVFNVGKAEGKMLDKNMVNVTFKDVAGLYGAKEEVVEIVDFLKNPKKYTALGAKIPKGALLVGPPGTGKTLLAKAVAGEANVPFFSISGSDFVEMFVGVGASRVRDLFRQAKEKAPCIVFIDEIDAVGRARGKNAGFSSNDERENTLNQLLTEMDGFGSNSGVIILAATNRADILDKALMRAGRFDRQIHVDLPDLNERKEIFAVHTSKLKLAEDFDVELISKHTAGFSGADIANVSNEAALTAARKGKQVVENEDFVAAVDRILGGIEKKKTIMTDDEKKIIACHEVGHTLVGWLLPKANPVLKVTIVPRGRALGLTWNLPDEYVIQDREQLKQELCMLMGGRVAEQIVTGSFGTGALNDLERLTKTAYAMVAYYGMSDKVGHLSFYDSTGSRGFELGKPYSEKTAEEIDAEVKSLVDEIHARTTQLILENKEKFDTLSQMLYEKEVLDAQEIESVLGPKAGVHGEARFAKPSTEDTQSVEDQPTTSEAVDQEKKNSDSETIESNE